MSRLIPVVLCLAFSPCLLAQSGSFAIRFDGDAPPGSRATVSAFAAGNDGAEVRYEQEFFFAVSLRAAIARSDTA